MGCCCVGNFFKIAQEMKKMKKMKKKIRKTAPSKNRNGAKTSRAQKKKIVLM